MLRAAIATGAALCAVAALAPGARGATFAVSNLNDSGAGSLRYAVSSANASAGADTVTFEESLAGTIRLTSGEIYVTGAGPLTIDGPGAGTLSVSGDANASGGAPDFGDSRIFNVFAGGTTTIEGLTLTGGRGAHGGALVTGPGTDVRLVDAAVTNSRAGLLSRGGGVCAFGSLTVERSVLSGNGAPTGAGGAIAFQPAGSSDALRIADSVIAANGAPEGGGVFTAAGSATIERTTIAGNQAPAGGGGILVGGLDASDRVTLSASTISGNDASGSFGGGLLFQGDGSAMNGAFDAVDSTISGNSAASGAGVSVGRAEPGVPVVGATGTISFAHSTVAANTASLQGGGIELADLGGGASVELASTLAADNSAAGAPSDLGRADGATAGGVRLAFSLVEAPGATPLTQNPPGTGIVGVDPQLGPLAANGGTTATQLPARTSPAVDAGNSPTPLALDQRGARRTVDGSGAPNAAGGDGTDIGAVEVQDPPSSGQVAPSPPEGSDGLPRAVITRNRLMAPTAGRRFVRGTASDDRAVAKVGVAVVREWGLRCRVLLPSRRFSKPRSCARALPFLRARGTSRWCFRPGRRLPPGNYTVYARATDDAGQVQTDIGPASTRLFAVWW
ncbi:MAG: hypothetical protein QOG63_1919 [Thermoleophilaceae bacterium]|nr:hypothetical protein [Thermoleophilaceae bacterium]